MMIYYLIEHKIATLWSAEFFKYIFNGPPNLFSTFYGPQA
jgi:hypothetical protein